MQLTKEKNLAIISSLKDSTAALTKKQEEKRKVDAIMASIQGPQFNVDFFNKVGSLYNRFSGWCSEQEEKVSQGIQWVGEKAGEAWDAAVSLTKNTIQSFIDNPVENLVKIDSGATILYLTVASFGTLSAVAALLGNTAAAAYGGTTVYAIYEYKSGDKEKGEEDLKKVALSAITMAGAFGAQGHVNVMNTPGGNVQSNGSMALEDGHLIGYSIVLEGVTSISSEVTDALGTSPNPRLRMAVDHQEQLVRKERGILRLVIQSMEISA